MSNRAPDPVDIQVGKAIRACRIIAGLSQTDLADKLGVTFQQVQKYEKGVNRVGAGRLSRIARVLNVDVASLFAGQAPPPQPQARATDTLPLGFISDRNALRLIRAYSSITEREIRQVLADLVEVIALARPAKPPASGGSAKRPDAG